MAKRLARDHAAVPIVRETLPSLVHRPVASPGVHWRARSTVHDGVRRHVSWRDRCHGRPAAGRRVLGRRRLLAWATGGRPRQRGAAGTAPRSGAPAPVARREWRGLAVHDRSVLYGADLSAEAGAFVGTGVEVPAPTESGRPRSNLERAQAEAPRTPVLTSRPRRGAGDCQLRGTIDVCGPLRRVSSLAAEHGPLGRLLSRQGRRLPRGMPQGGGTSMKPPPDLNALLTTATRLAREFPSAWDESTSLTIIAARWPRGRVSGTALSLGIRGQRCRTRLRGPRTTRRGTDFDPAGSPG